MVIIQILPFGVNPKSEKTITDLQSALATALIFLYNK